jgi:hypothetical protein
MNRDKDRRTFIWGVAALVAVIAIIAAGIALAGGGGDDETSSNPAPAAAPTGGASPPGDATPPDVASQLPPGIADCLADEGVDLEGLDVNEVMHGGAVPPQVLNECFERVFGTAH